MPEARPRRALYGIVAAVFVSGTGIGSLLPILPLFLRERGASYSLVGVIVGAALAAQAVGQWPAGWLAERIGRREMMVAGLLVAAAGSLMFLLPLSVEWLVVVRFVQGLGFAAAAPAEVALVADVVPADELGRSYGWVSAARQSGIIVGPAIGGLLAVFGRWTVFAVTGGALAGAAHRWLRHDPALLPATVDDGAFDGFDGDRVVVDVERAGGLARRRADAAGEFRKVVGRVQVARGLFPVAGIDQIVEIRNLVVDRAARRARRHRAGAVAIGNAAIHAARGLVAGVLLAQGDDELMIALHALGDVSVFPIVTVDLQKTCYLAH